MADQPPADDGPLSPEDEAPARDELARRETDLEVSIFDGVLGHDANPVLPVRLKADDRFCFSCHRGVPCWNTCCYGTDITLTPFDILRLTRRLGVKASEFLERYTVPATWEKAGMPVAKLKVQGRKGDGPCVFLDEEEGCTVYSDRPATCRYYPLGLAAVKMKGQEKEEDFHFLVKESHCQGHEEDKLQSVAEFRSEQGVEPYDEQNRGWIEIMMKMVSWRSIGGPGGREPSPETKRMFFMVSTDIDALRRFVFDTKFLDTYWIDEDDVERLKTDDEALLALGFDWMKNVLFNVSTLPMREDVLKRATAKARTDVGAG